MKLEPSLIRDLLLWAEENLPRSNGLLEFPVLEGWQKNEVAYNCLMAYEAKFLDAIDVQCKGDPFKQMIPIKLTYAGHQYLENIRDPEIWKKTTDGAKKIGNFSIETLGELAKGFVKQQIKRHTGMDLTD